MHRVRWRAVPRPPDSGGDAMQLYRPRRWPDHLVLQPLRQTCSSLDVRSGRPRNCPRLPDGNVWHAAFRLFARPHRTTGDGDPFFPRREYLDGPAFPERERSRDSARTHGDDVRLPGLAHRDGHSHSRTVSDRGSRHRLQPDGTGAWPARMDPGSPYGWTSFRSDGRTWQCRLVILDRADHWRDRSACIRARNLRQDARGALARTERRRLQRATRERQLIARGWVCEGVLGLARNVKPNGHADGCALKVCAPLP